MRMEDVLRQHGVPFKTEGDHHCRPGWLQTQCPYCGKGSGKYHLGYHLAYGYFNCYRCGPHGVTQTLAELAGVTAKEAFKLKGGIDFAVMTRREQHVGKYTPPPRVDVLLRPHLRYLIERGFDLPEVTRLWRVQGIGNYGNGLSWRLFIPVYFQGAVVSYTTRAVRGQEPRYKSAPSGCEAVPLHSILYGEDYATHTIIVHEGPLDVWATGPGAVATCGLSYSRAQVHRMAKYPRRGVCFDATPDAQQRARRLVRELTPFPGETFLIRLETGKDAASICKEERDELRRLLA